MFSEEKEMWKKFFDMFKKHFNEEVGLVPSVYESDDLDVDFIVGEKSGALFGVQVLQLFPEGELEEDEVEGEEEEDDDENDEDGPTGYVIEYRFVKTDKKVEQIKEKKLLSLEFEMESEGEDNEHIQLDFYGAEEEFTDVVVYIDKSIIGVYLEHEDFDF
ncbi:MAG: hypothetical protein ACTSRE_13660 [Promethearchaeota archaeon]